MLKAIPNKNAGFIILLTSIFILFYFGEIRILIIFIRLMDYNNSFSIIFLLFIFLLFLWIGAQFPLEKFLSYGRILIFYYYSVCVCVLLSRPSYRILTASCLLSSDGSLCQEVLLVIEKEEFGICIYLVFLIHFLMFIYLSCLY